MRTDRVYRKALAHAVAVDELASNAGSQFDPAIVATLLAIVTSPQALERAPAPAALPRSMTPRLAPDTTSPLALSPALAAASPSPTANDKGDPDGHVR